MGFFNKILEKLGIKKNAEEVAPAASSVAAKKPAASTSTGKPAAPKLAKSGVSARMEKDDVTSHAAVRAPVAISEVDVVKKLEGLSAGKELNWKVSIVDLLKLLDLDSSRESRNELAIELGCPADLMNDSAKMNTWLHKTVLRKIAENGGNIPQSLLD